MTLNNGETQMNRRMNRLEAIYKSLMLYGVYRLEYTDDFVNVLVTHEHIDQVYGLIEDRIGVEVDEDRLSIHEGVGIFCLEGKAFSYYYLGGTMLEMYQTLVERGLGYDYNKIMGVPKEDLEVMRKIGIYDNTAEQSDDFLTKYGNLKHYMRRVIEGESIQFDDRYRLQLKEGEQGKGLYITSRSENHFAGDSVATVYETCIQNRWLLEPMICFFEIHLLEEEEELLNTFMLYDE
ncbi:hypothetical protein NI470_05940 [Acinetobacter lwoffii]|uniref:hypothetical protein n=1 Tax=Acinetobacter lwoffii TaxID=28090 RepID=UPI00209A7E44|nr:hypothetical protein [Acinetobacter lwoffii]MCO8073039.1 hypothetical protein [Acinetobacter lwoffii]MCO8076147.1 hypothetical protein [Acinetobacter lwoffii]